MSSLANLPKEATLTPDPFEPKYAPESVEALKHALGQSKLPIKTYAMTQDKYGLKYERLRDLMHYWRDHYDIQAHMDQRLGELDNFVVDVPDGGISYKIHFVAHFSSNPDAIPLLLLHGWPGSVLEFVDVIKILRDSSDPAFHLVCPSQVGFGWSDKPPVDRHFTVFDSARILHTFMTGLGFKTYAAQGGDIGAMLARVLAKQYDECKAININYLPLPPPLSVLHAYLSKPLAEYIPSIAVSMFNRITKPILGPADTHGLTEQEVENAKRQAKFVESGRGYAIMHATRPATISYVVGSCPVSLLAWLGEKLEEWVDPNHPLTSDQILETVSFYYLLDVFPTSIYAYSSIPGGVSSWSNQAENYIKKPFGFSSFAHEISSAPKKWAQTCGKLEFYDYHRRGGHFAALENPVAFSHSMQECFKTIWPQQPSKQNGK